MQKKARVYITDIIDDDLAPERRIFDDVADVLALNARSEGELVGQIEDADCLMMYHFVSMGRETINSLQKCRVIVRCGVGFENVDIKAAREAGIDVCNVPDYGTEEVADSALAFALGLVRGTFVLNSKLRDTGADWHFSQAAPLRRLRGRTFGIVGMGRIGTATAHRAKAFGFNVVFYDPYVADGWDKSHGVSRADSLEALLAVSNILSINCEANEETAGMINAEAIELLPMGSYLINTARGVIVEAAAIPPAIYSGRLAGAGIDVLKEEPPPGDDPLIAAWRNPDDPCHDRVVIVPHTAFYSEESLMDMRTKGSESCRRAILGEPQRNVVNKGQSPFVV